MKLNRNEKYVKWGLTAFLVIVAAGLFWLVFSNLRGFYDLIVEFLNIIAALLYGCLFAYLMNPVMKVTQRIMDKLLAKRNLSDRMAARISKITGICAAVLVFCLAVYALIALIVPNLIASIEELLQPEKLESYYATISKWFRGIFTNSDIQSFLEKTVGDPLEMVIGWLKKLDYSVIVTSLTSSVYSVVMVIFNILLGIVAAVYILIFKEELCAQAKKVTVAVFSRQHADRLLELARRTNSIFGGYVMGKIIDAVLVGVITYFGVLFMGMPYAALIGTIVGVTNIIPFFGPFLGAVPSACISAFSFSFCSRSTATSSKTAFWVKSSAFRTSGCSLPFWSSAVSSALPGCFLACRSLPCSTPSSVTASTSALPVSAIPCRRACTIRSAPWTTCRL